MNLYVTPIAKVLQSFEFPSTCINVLKFQSPCNLGLISERKITWSVRQWQLFPGPGPFPMILYCASSSPMRSTETSMLLIQRTAWPFPGSLYWVTPLRCLKFQFKKLFGVRTADHATLSFVCCSRTHVCQWWAQTATLRPYPHLQEISRISHRTLAFVHDLFPNKRQQKYTEAHENTKSD